ncbi:unnamed protein product, partial [Musa acuminata var. zebrina]
MWSVPFFRSYLSLSLFNLYRRPSMYTATHHFPTWDPDILLYEVYMLPFSHLHTNSYHLCTDSNPIQ